VFTLKLYFLIVDPRVACPANIFSCCKPRSRHSTISYTPDEGHKEHLRWQPFYC